ncbi:MAG: DUF429 domain-containing protein [Desulfobacterales bacterium]|nr:DUF429 domain-containing protein [Desulfobacterales bacterium]
MISVGADGCKAGWFSVILSDNNWEINIFPDIKALWENCQDASLILLDIPIGLRKNSKIERLCDLEARKLLGKRKSSVFPAPCREAVYRDSYEEASDINKKLTGRGLSLQTWNIMPKIREVDILLSENKNARSQIREIHPEICFYAFSGQPMKYSKKKKEGYFERYDILKKIYPSSEDIISKALSKYYRKEVAKDDILDALSAAITARFGKNNLDSIPKIPELDSIGMPMEMVYKETSCLHSA